MKTVVVGGQSRKAGKTSVTAGLIAAFSGYPWTAVKLSSHWHTDGPQPDICAIHEESSREGKSDSSRFLAAGARRSFWIRVREGKTGEAMPRLQPILQSNPFVIIESNRILQYIRPDIYVMVLRYDLEEFKASARETLGRADAIVAVTCDSRPPSWMDTVRETAAGVPLFTTSDPLVIPAGLVDLVRSKIQDRESEIRGSKLEAF